MVEQFRHRFLSWWAGVVSRRPGWILFIGCVLAVACVAYTYGNLHFQSDRNKLISQDLPWNQRFMDWFHTFSGTSDMVIVVDTYGPNGKPSPQAEARAKKVVRALGPRLEQSKWVKRAVWGFDPDTISPKAMRLEPMAQFKSHLSQIEQSKTLLASPTPQALLASAVAQMRSGFTSKPDLSESSSKGPDQEKPPASHAQDIDSFTALINAFAKRMKTPADKSIDLAAAITGETPQDAWQFLRTENGRLMLILISPVRAKDVLSTWEPAIRSIRDILHRFQASNPDVAMGLTGSDVTDTDETRVANQDSTFTTLLAALLVAILLITAFHSFRLPMMLMFSLGVGIAWTFGYVTVAVGHLQIISVIFAIMLLGLGAAYGIYIASRFELIRHNYPDTLDGFTLALQDTLTTVGPGIITGAMTAAAAFCTTMLTQFTGVAEMGEIASVGIILCLISMCSVFPALLRLFKPYHKHVVHMEDRYIHFFEERWVMPFSRHPRPTLIVAAALTAISLVAVSQMHFSYNLMDLMPRGVPSVEWQKKIVTQGDQSIWFGVSVVGSIEKARRLAQQFRKLATVESVRGIGLLFPPNDDQKRAMIREARTQLGDTLSQAASGISPSPPGGGRVGEPANAISAPSNVESQGTNAPSPSPSRREGSGKISDEPASAGGSANGLPKQNLVSQLAAMRLGLTILSGQLPEDLQPYLSRLSHAIGDFLTTARQLTPKQRQTRLAALQRDYQHWRTHTAKQIQSALDASPLKPSDLPPTLIQPYIAHTDAGTKYALEVYARPPPPPAHVTDPAYLKRFINDLKSVDPDITGVVVQIYNSGTLIWESIIRAGFYALLAVFILVMLDFRSLHDALLNLVPVGMAFAVTFGVMYISGETLNPANIIVLPLMFGIGVDAGVQIVHRYRAAPTLRPLGLTAGTGKGITLISLNAIIGFGCMLLARHRGIASLGFVLTIGICFTLMASWTIMPAWLELRTRAKERT